MLEHRYEATENHMKRIGPATKLVYSMQKTWPMENVGFVTVKLSSSQRLEQTCGGIYLIWAESHYDIGREEREPGGIRPRHEGRNEKGDWYFSQSLN